MGCRIVRCAAGVGLAFALALSAAAPVRAEAAASPPVGLDYGLHLGGLQGLAFAVRLDLAADVYDVRVQARTDGMAEWLFPFIMEARSRGLRRDSGLQPRRYATANRWGKTGKHWMTVDYPRAPGEAGRLPEVAAEPPLGAEDRSVVPEETRRGTLDPVSAVFGIVLDSADGCGGRHEIFDGRRRYDLVAEDLGPGTVPPSDYGLYSGPARLCRITLEQVEGAWAENDARRRYPDSSDVWLARVAANLPPLPVRLEADTLLGALRVHLTGMRRGKAADLPPSDMFPLRAAQRD